MILINLLPHREAARKRRQEIFNLSLGASALAGGLLAGVIFLWLQEQTSSQEEINSVLTAENRKLDDQIKDIAALETEIAALRARQQAVENLQADRNMPVLMMGELTRQIPEGIFLTTLKQDGQLLMMQGTAQSQERVSELLRNLAYNSPWFAKPELVEIVAANLQLGREQRRVANFNMRVRMVRASELQKPASEPGAPAPAKSGPSAVKR